MKNVRNLDIVETMVSQFVENSRYLKKKTRMATGDAYRQKREKKTQIPTKFAYKSENPASRKQLSSRLPVYPWIISWKRNESKALSRLYVIACNCPYIQEQRKDDIVPFLFDFWQSTFFPFFTWCMLEHEPTRFESSRPGLISVR